MTHSPLREKCPYSDLFCSAISPLWTEYGEILRISPCSVQMGENVNQNNCKYRHLLPSVCVSEKIELIKIEVQYIIKALNFGTFHRFS